MGTLPLLPQFLPSHNTETEAQHREWESLAVSEIYTQIHLVVFDFFFPKRKSNLVTFLLF